MEPKKEAYLYDNAGGNNVRCKNCAHYCKIASGKRGRCGVRENNGGILYALNYGKAATVAVDPVEKKPLFHFLPGTETLSYATVGCNLACANCQNWEISQYPKNNPDIPGNNFPPQSIVDIAKQNNLPSISYTYVEPTIFSEYALDTMKIAHQNGIKNIWVSNGFMSKESAEMVIPYLDAINIDIKSFSDDFYKNNCGARLQPVLNTAKRMKDAGVWVEITTLIIPTLNDSDKNITDIANFIVNDLGIATPWHLTQFLGEISWKLKYVSNTSANTLRKAHDMGKKTGLKYVYSGNMPGMDLENTYCPTCKTLVIERNNYIIRRHDAMGKCFNCGTFLDIIQD